MLLQRPTRLGQICGPQAPDTLAQGLLATMVADTAPVDLRGTAFGVFNLVSGLAMLVASGVAGWLRDRHGAATTFLGGAAFATVTLAGLLVRQIRFKGR